jgi:hypothetical protein
VKQSSKLSEGYSSSMIPTTKSTMSQEPGGSEAAVVWRDGNGPAFYL